MLSVGCDRWFVNGTRYVFGDLNSWGWVALCLGVLQLLVGLGVFAKNQFARWTGIALLSVSAIGELLYMPEYPFWSLCLFAIDILAIYALAAYGRRMSGPASACSDADRNGLPWRLDFQGSQLVVAVPHHSAAGLRNLVPGAG